MDWNDVASESARKTNFILLWNIEKPIDTWDEPWYLLDDAQM